jgi:hypothetical protein
MIGMSKEAVIKRTAGIYNMIPNLFWTALLLIPVTVFCYSWMEPKLFWIFFTISMLAILLPPSFFDIIQLSNTATFYKRIGVGFINRFTQNGDIVNKLLRKKYPGYQVVSKEKKSVQQFISQTYVFEKFHFMLFLFFIMIIVYSLAKGYYIWAFVFFVSNIVYNIYPALLQQYLRVRLKKTLERDAPARNFK